MVASLNQTTHVPNAAAKESTRQIKLIARLKTKRKFRKGASNTQKVRCHGKIAALPINNTNVRPDSRTYEGKTFIAC